MLHLTPLKLPFCCWEESEASLSSCTRQPQVVGAALPLVPRVASAQSQRAVSSTGGPGGHIRSRPSPACLCFSTSTCVWVCRLVIGRVSAADLSRAPVHSFQTGLPVSGTALLEPSVSMMVGLVLLNHPQELNMQKVKAPDCSTLGPRKARSCVISAWPFLVVPGDPAMPPAPLPRCFRGPTFQACPHQRPSADTQGCSKHHSTSAFSRKSRGCLGGPGR
ncbi:uncharacterized protein LOC108308055 [Cebus imitator]|uniref:uncharacterized protein LOC108308055 n=1 Tax=Cebus imitator TaxID=2715852 RepID=UPI000809E0FA|nr:uncharacterized protein LOC108308055 [Cebus imitator]